MKKIINISSFSRSQLNQDPIDGSFYGWHSRFARVITKETNYQVESWSIDVKIKKKLSYQKDGIKYSIFPVSFYVAPGREISLSLLKSLNKEVEQNEVIIHLHDFHNWQAYFISILFKRYPIVCHCHGATRRPLQKIRDFKKIFFLPILLLEQMAENYALKNVDHYFISNSGNKDYFLKRKIKHTFCPMAVNLENFYPVDKTQARKIIGFKNRGKLILNVGGFAFPKNLELLIISLAEIVRKMPVFLYLIGPTYNRKYRRKIIGMIKKYNLGGYVKIEGMISQNQLNFYYNAADVLVVSSIREGGPIVILESLAAGTPVVSTPVGFTKDIISKSKGLLKIASLSPSSFSQKITSALLAKNQKDQATDKEISASKIWTWNEVIKSIEPVYKDLFIHRCRQPKLAVQKAVQAVGQTDWYSNLHYRRFVKTLETVNNYIDLTKNPQILDIGSWPGYLTMSLSEMGAKVTVLDLEPERIKILGKFIDISAIKIDLNHFEKLPLKSNFYDGIVLGEIVEHLNPSKIPNILSELKRALKPGGFIILTTPNKFCFGNLVRFYFWNKKFETDHSGHGHCREYSQREIEFHFRNCGLKICKSQLRDFYSLVGKANPNSYFYPIFLFLKHKNKKHNLFKMMSWPIRSLIPIFRDTIVIVGKKE